MPSEGPLEYKPTKMCLKIAISPGLIFGILRYVDSACEQWWESTENLCAISNVHIIIILYILKGGTDPLENYEMEALHKALHNSTFF